MQAEKFQNIHELWISAVGRLSAQRTLIAPLWSIHDLRVYKYHRSVLPETAQLIVRLHSTLYGLLRLRNFLLIYLYFLLFQIIPAEFYQLCTIVPTSQVRIFGAYLRKKGARWNFKNTRNHIKISHMLFLYNWKYVF